MKCRVISCLNVLLRAMLALVTLMFTPSLVEANESAVVPLSHFVSSSLCILCIVQIFLLQHVTWSTDKAGVKPVRSKQMDAWRATTALSAVAANKDAECYWGELSQAENGYS